ncbi:Protoporphyrin IX Mg-chelatase subunit D [Rhodovulum sp. P5]|uniref:hypothetical protein n=1 Tax=Rhodovulum sp. P5 TaxID=1564506 RepID=UPI0009C1F513|nr:Protoporphyrin IX Mg-chelatase subunit D [Rhodovulum sp. P5]
MSLPDNSVWTRAEVGLNALAVDPAGLGGMWLRARSGPVRDRVTAALSGLPLPQKRLHPSIGDDQLFGGIDLTATLSSGRLVQRKGLLADPATLVLPMAERTQPGLAARLAGAMDQGAGHCLIALDEGAEPEEALPTALTDRLALHVDLDALPYGETEDIVLDQDALAEARARLPKIRAADKVLEDLTLLAIRLGVDSLRAPMLALRCARALAAIAGNDEVEADDLTAAVQLVLGPAPPSFPKMSRRISRPPTNRPHRKRNPTRARTRIRAKPSRWKTCRFRTSCWRPPKPPCPPIFWPLSPRNAPTGVRRAVPGPGPRSRATAGAARSRPVRAGWRPALALTSLPRCAQRRPGRRSASANPGSSGTCISARTISASSGSRKNPTGC